MTPYSVCPRDQIFLKSYGFLSFAKNMGKNIVKKITKNFSGKYNQTRLDHTKQSATDVLKTASKKVIQKSAEETVNLISNTSLKKKYKSFKNFTTKYFRNSWKQNRNT